MKDKNTYCTIWALIYQFLVCFHLVVLVCWVCQLDRKIDRLETEQQRTYRVVDSVYQEWNASK